MTQVRAGEVIAGKFKIERIIGEGGMGYVVAARHLQLGQTFALKFMREEVCTSELKSRFLREARNTVRLKSRHVARVLDVGALDDGVPYMVMEYLEGVDLSALLHERGSFTPSEACEYVIQACEAIAEAHDHGIIHRDLKPANLFLTRGSGGEPVVKVLDFGVSKVLEFETDDETLVGGRGARFDSVITKATDLLGSPSYMAPEQVVSARDADARSDVWSLGVILYRLISGRPPFTGHSLGALIQNVMHGPMPNLRNDRPDLPEGLEYVLQRCMAREKKERPDAVELARLLAPYAGPNASPSVERIAVLGSSLVTADVPATGAPSYAHDDAGGLSPEIGSISTLAMNEISRARIVRWAVVVAATALVVVLGVKFLWPKSTPGHAALSSASANVPEAAPGVVPLATTWPTSVNLDAASIAPPPSKPSATPTARPHPLPSGGGHSRPGPAPKSPISDIPSTRD